MNLDRLLVSIYRMPMGFVVLILLLAAALMATACRRYRNCRWLGFGLRCALLLWLTAVIYTTLLSRTGTERPVPCFIPCYSYWQVLNGGSSELLRSNFMNVTLFYPCGVLVRALWPEGRYPGRMVATVLLVGCFSFGIEWCQYHFALGTSELDDLLHNTLGVLLGWLCYQNFLNAVDPIRPVSA